MMKYSKIALICVLVTTLCGCGCAKRGRELPPVDPASFQRYSQDNILDSKILGRTVKYSVYYPESYMSDKEKRYPVVYILHGIGDDNNSWNVNYLHANNKVDALTAKGLGEMIYVFPQGFSSYYCNRYDGSFNYMDMFVKELIPLIDKTLRTIPDKQHRSITGYSMGGFGAMALAEKNPDLFIACAPLSMSVRTDWQYIEESQNGWNEQWGKIFGGTNRAGEERITDYYKQHCPLYYFNDDNKEALATVNWYLICGDNEENLLFANDALHCIMRDHNYEHEYRVVDGGHSSSVWMPALDEVLPMFDYYMNGGSLWTESFYADAQLATVDTDENGAYVSGQYLENKIGTALFLVHNQIPDEIIKAIMNALVRPSSKIGYVLLPCDISSKSLNEWMQFWKGQFNIDKSLVLGIAEGAEDILNTPADTFKRYYFINPKVGNNPLIEKDQEIYFAGTETDSYYWDMDALYSACKKNEAKFEYRVINSSNDKTQNILKSIETIKSFIYY